MAPPFPSSSRLLLFAVSWSTYFLSAEGLVRDTFRNSHTGTSTLDAYDVNAGGDIGQHPILNRELKDHRPARESIEIGTRVQVKNFCNCMFRASALHDFILFLRFSSQPAPARRRPTSFVTTAADNDQVPLRSSSPSEESAQQSAPMARPLQSAFIATYTTHSASNSATRSGSLSKVGAASVSNSAARAEPGPASKDLATTPASPVIPGFTHLVGQPSERVQRQLESNNRHITIGPNDDEVQTAEEFISSLSIGSGFYRYVVSGDKHVMMIS